jgi:hypothetical protein
MLMMDGAMQKTVESGACHDRVTGEDMGPFGKGLIGGDGALLDPNGLNEARRPGG